MLPRPNWYDQEYLLNKKEKKMSAGYIVLAFLCLFASIILWFLSWGLGFETSPWLIPIMGFVLYVFCILYVVKRVSDDS